MLTRRSKQHHSFPLIQGQGTRVLTRLVPVARDIVRAHVFVVISFFSSRLVLFCHESPAPRAMSAPEPDEFVDVGRGIDLERRSTVFVPINDAAGRLSRGTHW